MNAQEIIINALSRWFVVNHLWDTDPTLASTKLKPPIFVTGMPRTGTTALHRLLCQLRGTRTLAFHDQMRPGFVTPSPFRKWIEDLMFHFKVWLWSKTVPELDAMHYLRSHLPEECIWTVGSTLISMSFWEIGSAFDYFDWMLGQNMVESYEFYRRALTILQRESPNKTFLLKAPFHSLNLRDLHQVFPDATIVICHRSPLETVPSVSKMHILIAATAAWPVQAVKVGEYTRKRQILYTKAIVRDSPVLQADKVVVHVSYQEFMKNPIPIVRAIAEKAGLSFSEEKLSDHISKKENKQHAHGFNRYSLAQFGLLPERVLNDYAPYLKMFSEYVE